jgi:lipopolysaccharide transport system permease protein
VVTYKQTILGPLWLFVMPLLTSLTYVVLFGNIAKLSTDGVPQLLFYLTGNALWMYFSNCVTRCSETFTSNANLFGKVYFPRLVVPLSDVLGSAIRFCIQMIMVLALMAYYVARGMITPHYGCWVLIPLLLVLLGIMGMGFGIIISSLTTRYRDLQVLVSFGMSLWMYATPVVYPLSMMSGTLRKLLLLNPVTEPMELFRYALLGVGTFAPLYIGLSLLITAVVVFAGIVIFNRVERTFMDTV